MRDRKAISFEQAITCEQGIAARCRCRCKGTLHGARRLGKTPTYSDFRTLPLGDPHRVNQRHRDLIAVETRTGVEHASIGD